MPPGKRKFMSDNGEKNDFEFEDLRKPKAKTNSADKRETFEL